MVSDQMLLFLICVRLYYHLNCFPRKRADNPYAAYFWSCGASCFLIMPKFCNVFLHNRLVLEL